MSQVDADSVETARILYPFVLEAIKDMGGRAWADEVTDYIRETQGHNLTSTQMFELSSIVQIALYKAVGLKDLVYNGHYEMYSPEALRARDEEAARVDAGAPVKLTSQSSGTVSPHQSPVPSRRDFTYQR